MAMALGILGSVVGFMGSMVQAQGTIAAGEAQQQQYEYQAKQMEAKGKEELAASQREAIQKQKEGTLVQSRIQAGAAASGFGAGSLDPTIVDLASDVAEQEYLNKGMELYGGKSRQNAYNAQAAADRYSGEIAVMGAKTAAQGQMFSGFSGLLSSFGSFASKYGAPTPDFTMNQMAPTNSVNNYGYSYF